jgi:hypothetical protein
MSVNATLSRVKETIADAMLGFMQDIRQSLVRINPECVIL